MRRIKGMKKALLAVSMTLALTMGVGLTGPAMVVPVYADENNQQNNNQQNNNQQNNDQQEEVASLGKDGYISELQDYANNKIISNGLSKEQATAISNVMNSAINAIKNRYGLLELDLNTSQRIPKKSLYWLQNVMQKGELSLK